MTCRDFRQLAAHKDDKQRRDDAAKAWSLASSAHLCNVRPRHRTRHAACKGLTALPTARDVACSGVLGIWVGEKEREKDGEKEHTKTRGVEKTG